MSQLCLGLPRDVFPSGEGIIEEHSTSHVTNIDVNFTRQHQGKHKAGLKSNSLLSFIELMLNMRQNLPLHVSDRVKPRGVSGFRDKGMLFPIIFYWSNGLSNIYSRVLCDTHFNACVMTLSTSITKRGVWWIYFRPSLLFSVSVSAFQKADNGPYFAYAMGIWRSKTWFKKYVRYFDQQWVGAAC